MVVMATRDGVLEWEEELYLVLSAVAQSVLVEPSIATITIKDTDCE